METDAKGQLGGLECTKEERERLAASSKTWKCAVCQKTNKEILDESSEAARLKEEEEGSAPKEQEVPKELKIAYTDQKNAGGSAGASESKSERDDEAQLAEGFVRTGNADGADAGPSSSTTKPYPHARPAQSVPIPTTSAVQSTHTQPQVTAAPRFPPQQQVQVRSNEGIPLWIDRSIAAVVICLVAMILKVLLGV
jgi:ubiquitin-conjugating enzyme E2 J1